MKNQMPSGAWPVLFTPFTEDDRIDFEALDELMEFYIGAGVAGVFSSCLSGEVLDTSLEENLALNRRIVARNRGRIAIVAGGNFGETLEEQVRSILRMRETGVDQAVVILSLLPSAENLADQLFRLSDMTELPLGIYECPEPEHRLLTFDEIARIGHSGRFFFMKDTCRDNAVFAKRMEACKGTPLQLFLAHLRCLPGALELGSPGHCGVVVNVCPELSRAYCLERERDPRERAAMHASLQAIHDAMVANAYPASGKYILMRRGLPLTPKVRTAKALGFNEKNRRALDAFLAKYDFRQFLESP